MPVVDPFHLPGRSLRRAAVDTIECDRSIGRRQGGVSNKTIVAIWLGFRSLRMHRRGEHNGYHKKHDQDAEDLLHIDLIATQLNEDS